MSERDTQVQRDVGVDVGVGIDESEEETNEGGIGAWIRSKLGALGSTGGLVVSTVLALGGAMAGGLLPLGIIGNALGIFLGGFVYGVVASDHHYVEFGFAATLIAALIAVFGNLVMTIAGPGIPIVLVGAGIGLVAGLVGHYFGRDLRAGLVRDIGSGDGP
jgi:hypothetical protein